MTDSWIDLAQVGRASMVQRAERKFPSVCIQGDTLYTWLREITEVLAQSQAQANEQLQFHAKELYAIVDTYARLCRQASRPVPFEWPDPAIEEELLEVP